MRCKSGKNGKNGGPPLLVVFREPTRAELLAEWRRRRAQCASDMAEARKAGDFVAYRDLRRRWDRYYAKDYDRPDRESAARSVIPPQVRSPRGRVVIDPRRSDLV